MNTPSASTISLPAGWDFGRDLVILLGADNAATLTALEGAGQKRVIEASTQGERNADLTAKIFELQGALPVHVAIHCTGTVDRESQQEVARAASDALRSKRLMTRTVELSGPTWLLQSLANLPLLARWPSVDALRDRFAGKPCVIVSPGPSLSGNIEHLTKVGERALIMCGTHALGALAKWSIAPDLVVAADPGDLLRHWEGTDQAEVGAVVVAATCQPDQFELDVARKFSFAGNGEIDGWIYSALGEEARLPTGGSVACSELSLALLMGCDPIVYVGQDLSFPGGRFYAEETLDGNAHVERTEGGRFFLRKPEGAEGPGDELDDGGLRFTRDQELIEVPGYHGGTVPTSESFAAFLTWFEAVAGTLTNEGNPTRLINSTEGGARIRGFEQLPLSDVLAGLASEPIGVHEQLDRATAGASRGERRQQLAREVEVILETLAPAAKLARRCRSLAAKKKVDELGRAEAALQQALSSQRLFSLLAQREIVGAQEKARLATTLEENLAAAEELFRVVERGAEQLREPLQAARSALAQPE